MFGRNPKLWLPTCVCLTLAVVSGATARGDVFVLNNGGRIEGRLVESAGDDKDYIIETASGRMTIARAQVSRIDAASADEKEYAALAKDSPDTVEAHWKLYEWCRSRKLREQAQKHLTRILELDPNHAEARTILGFRKQGEGWVTRDDVMSARGMVKYEGQYYTRQHVELMEQQKAAKDTQVDWRKDLAMWRGWLTGRRADRAAEAREKITNIRDPQAADAIAAALDREKDPAIQQLWLEVLAKLDSSAAIQALVDHSLNDPNEEIRRQCVDYLIATKKRGLLSPYLKALKASDNVLINRAATALGQIGDPAAIGPLIDVLVTVHKEKVSDGGQMSMSMSNGGSGLSMGGGPKIVSREVRNADVRTALLQLTRIPGFEYDQDGWRNWYASQAKAQRVEMRRDL
jgi:hypothetical protein